MIRWLVIAANGSATWLSCVEAEVKIQLMGSAICRIKVKLESYPWLFEALAVFLRANITLMRQIREHFLQSHSLLALQPRWLFYRFFPFCGRPSLWFGFFSSDSASALVASVAFPGPQSLSNPVIRGWWCPPTDYRWSLSGGHTTVIGSQQIQRKPLKMLIRLVFRPSAPNRRCAVIFCHMPGGPIEPGCRHVVFSFGTKARAIASRFSWAAHVNSDWRQ